MQIIQAQLRLHRKTSTDLSNSNPILLEGQKVTESDTGLEKTGDGVTRWNLLPYLKVRLQDIINYTVIELNSNKSIDIDTDKTSNIKYPSVKAIYDWISTNYQTSLSYTPENIANKVTDILTNKTSNIKYPSAKAIYDWVFNNYATKEYAESLVVGLLDDRGSYDASSNVFPSTGGSGLNGAILKGDLWFCSVAGNLGGQDVQIGSSFRALIDNPGQTASDWNIISTTLGFTPENVANKTSNIIDYLTSTTKYWSVKGVVDWCNSMFATIAMTFKASCTQTADATIGDGQTHTFNFNNGNVQKLTKTGTGTSTIAFSNVPIGVYSHFKILAFGFGTGTVVLPVGHKKLGTTTFTFTSEDVILCSFDKDGVLRISVVAVN